MFVCRVALCLEVEIEVVVARTCQEQAGEEQDSHRGCCHVDSVCLCAAALFTSCVTVN